MLTSGREVVAQDLKVLVLDALNGRPQVSVKVGYFCTGRPSKSQPNAEAASRYSVITDGE